MKGEAEKEDIPQVPRKDLEMAEKVSKYNVSVIISLLFFPKCPHIEFMPYLMCIVFTLNSGLLKFLNPLPLLSGV